MEQTASTDSCSACGKKVREKKFIAPEGFKMNPAYVQSARYEFDPITQRYIELCSCDSNNETGSADSWFAARARMFRFYRYAYGMGIMASAWRALYLWFLWDVYDKILHRMR